MIIRKCKVCAKDFNCNPSQDRRNKIRSFCSRECYYQFRINNIKPLRVCAICDKKIGQYCKGGRCIKCKLTHPQTIESKMKISKTKMAEKNPMWKGNKVGYGALHDWIKSRFPKQKLCNICKIKRPMDLANISQKYKRDINDWEWLCRRCHMIKDGRMKNLKHCNNKYGIIIKI